MLHPLLRHLPLALALCAAGAAQAKNLVVCTEASPEGFDIVQYTGAVTADASAETVFNRLLAFRPGTTEVIPGLAERWDVSADGLSYTFHLRPGVKFHTTDYFKPTRSLNADDVLWTFQRALDPKHPWHASALRGYAYFDAMGMGELIKSVEKVDELTVRFVLNRPEAPFLRDMAMPFASIYSAEYGDQLLAAGKQGQLNNQPIGTGPFVFKRYAKDAQVRYTANPDYYAGKPPIDNLVFAITLDPNVRMQKVRQGGHGLRRLQAAGHARCLGRLADPAADHPAVVAGRGDPRGDHAAPAQRRKRHADPLRSLSGDCRVDCFALG